MAGFVNKVGVHLGAFVHQVSLRLTGAPIYSTYDTMCAKLYLQVLKRDKW